MNPITPAHFRERVLPTPFHSRTSAHNRLKGWCSWKGYASAGVYENVEDEYFAIRNACAVFDLSPLCKYRLRGREAGAFLNHLVTRDLSPLAPGRVAYALWCDDRGRVIGDGTVFHLGENDYRLCCQERQLDWLYMSALGFDVEIVEETAAIAAIAALAVQGPTSCAVLQAMGLDGVHTLKPFELRTFAFDGGHILVSRTGFTGDLGYEVWLRPEQAEALWDTLFGAGRDYGIRPIGKAALDMARIEAGFIQAGVDYMPALTTIVYERTRSPFELGLDRLVHFDKPAFTGRRALAKEKATGSRYRLLKLDIEGNKPATNAFLYLRKTGRPVGTVTSALWSPSCKANIALASVEAKRAAPGKPLWAEIHFQRELHWHRTWARARQVSGPFWNPPRRTATPAALF